MKLEDRLQQPLHLGQVFYKRLRAAPEKILQFHKSSSEWTGQSYSEVFQLAKKTAKSLLALDHRPSDKVAFLISEDARWSSIQLATLGTKLVSVPISSSMGIQDIVYILNQVESALLFVDKAAPYLELQKFLKKHPQSLLHLKKVIPLIHDPAFKTPLTKEIATLSWDQFLKLGTSWDAPSITFFEDGLLHADAEEVYGIFYTQGTTGSPKGVILTLDNIASAVEDLAKVLAQVPNQRALSYLSISNVTKHVEWFLSLQNNWENYHANHWAAVAEDLNAVRPRILFAPSHRVDHPKLFKKWKTWKKLPKIALQSQPRILICIGGALPKEITESLRSLPNLQLFEGYGLTECSGFVSINTPSRAQSNSVGKPLPEVLVKIHEEDREILVKSRKIFRGYFRLPFETSKVLQDGWLRTGDIGNIDPQGYLHILGRKMDLIISSQGEKFTPETIEALAKRHPWVSHFVVLGHRRKYLTALITLKEKPLLNYAAEQHIFYGDVAGLIKNPKIIGVVSDIINQLNLNLKASETIRKFVILPHDLSIEAGELTPGLAPKRNAITRKYRTELDRLYREG